MAKLGVFWASFPAWNIYLRLLDIQYTTRIPLIQGHGFGLQFAAREERDSLVAWWAALLRW